MSVAKKLQQFGLSEKEAKIYHTLLGFNKAVVSDIAKKSGINRSTVYIILESLREQRLVNVSEKNNVQYFSAAPPKKLKDIASDKLSQAQSCMDVADDIVKTLGDSYKGVGDRPQLVVYEGLDGLKNALADFGIYNVEADYDSLARFLKNPQMNSEYIKAKNGSKIFVAHMKGEYCYILENSLVQF